MNRTGRVPITFGRDGFVIDGRPTYLLTGSAFYFRLHPNDWRDRLRMVKAARFNAVDVYAPWNLHEPVEGSFDFEGACDLGRYLELCGEVGLYVYLRPGPYICNECDGGGLPAWLYTKSGVGLRQNEPNYLGCVRRYFGRVNAVARPHLYSNGGPIVLYALENELDFYERCEDPAGYIAALRDMVRDDGVDVPLCACIGLQTKLRRATGLVEGVLPTPNIYGGGAVERKATHAYHTVLAGRYRDGSPMSDTPVFVTEMGRSENDLRRIASAGVKGLGPFNFVGGSTPGRHHGTNNWGGSTFIASVIDFEGMVDYAGNATRHFFDARRLAGMIQAFEAQWLACAPTSSTDGGPRCTNPLMGVIEKDDGPARVYSLESLDGRSGFVFVYNGTRQPEATKLEINGRVVPCASELAVGVCYDHVVPFGVSLEHVGLPMTIDYSTAEVCELMPTDAGAVLKLCGEPGASGELSVDGELIVVTFEPACERAVRRGDRVLTIQTMTREQAGRDGLGRLPALGEPRDLLAGNWQTSELPATDAAEHWSGEARAMEELGVHTGAGWYSGRFKTTADAASLTLDYAADIIGAYLDGAYVGTYVCDGNPLTIEAPGGLASGGHELRVRAEIWGHSNFDDPKWPARRLGSLRGIAGALRIDGRAIDCDWSFGAERDALVGKTMQACDAPCVAGGQHVAVGTTLDAPMPDGAVLTLAGENCHGDIWLRGELVGRYAFGPAMQPQFAGGPADRFYLPGTLCEQGVALVLVMRGTGDGGRITAARVEPRFGRTAGA